MTRAQSFSAELVEGHKRVTVVIVPFDPETRWRQKPVRLDRRRDGWLVEGLVNGVPFEGGTWQYFLRKRSRTEIQQLLSDPRVGARHVTQSFTAP